MASVGMADTRYHQQIILTHWNAGVFHVASLPQLLPELAIYSLLYDEVLIREEDLLTNRAITRLLSDENNFAVFSELLRSGLVKLLRLPLEFYPPGRRFDPVLLPITARAEEHQLRRTYKGNPWKPTTDESQFFRRLDEIVTKFPSASRYHTRFREGNRFAAELAEILENRDSYPLRSHPVFRYIKPETANQFLTFCRDPEAWLRFLHEHGVRNPIVGPDTGFYRSAAYQCSDFLPTPRAIRRLTESVYAAVYCERESSDGRYGGSELVELPYRYPSDRERTIAAEDAIRIEIVPTEAAANVAMQPGLAAVLVRTRASPEFEFIRRTIEALGTNPESPLLTETRFHEAWRSLCAVYAENSAEHLETSTSAGHYATRYLVYAYVLARVLGIRILPTGGTNFDLPVAADAAVIAAVERFGPTLLKSFRASVRIPALQERMEGSASIRCSTVPLAVVPQVKKE
jgi:hypothetical protein